MSVGIVSVNSLNYREELVLENFDITPAQRNNSQHGIYYKLDPKLLIHVDHKNGFKFSPFCVYEQNNNSNKALIIATGTDLGCAIIEFFHKMLRKCVKKVAYEKMNLPDKINFTAFHPRCKHPNCKSRFEECKEQGDIAENVTKKNNFLCYYECLFKDTHFKVDMDNPDEMYRPNPSLITDGLPSPWYTVDTSKNGIFNILYGIFTLDTLFINNSTDKFFVSGSVDNIFMDNEPAPVTTESRLHPMLMQMINDHDKTRQHSQYFDEPPTKKKKTTTAETGSSDEPPTKKGKKKKTITETGCSDEPPTKKMKKKKFVEVEPASESSSSDESDEKIQIPF